MKYCRDCDGAGKLPDGSICNLARGVCSINTIGYSAYEPLQDKRTIAEQILDIQLKAIVRVAERIAEQILKEKE